MPTKGSSTESKSTPETKAGAVSEPKSRSKAKATAKVTASVAKPGVPKEAALAFARLETEIEALPPDQVQPVNLDVPRAVAVAIGAAPHIHALRARLVDELPRFPIRYADEIATYAMAAWFAHLLALPATAEGQLAALLEEATPLRADLLVAAEALAHKGYFDAKVVAAIREGRGNIDTADDLVALSALFAREWDDVSHKTTVEWAEVQRASELGPQILVALGERDQPGIKAPNPADPAQRRQRACTLFVRAYDECQRAVSYLRWHEDDVDSIAPSLWAGRPRRSSSRQDTPSPSADPTAAEPTSADPKPPSPAAPPAQKDK